MDYPNLGNPLINEYPLFQLGLFGAWKMGWWGLFLGTGALYALLMTSLLRAAWLLLPKGTATLRACSRLDAGLLPAGVSASTSPGDLCGPWAHGHIAACFGATPKTGPSFGRWR